MQHRHAKLTLMLLGWLALISVALSDARREVWAQDLEPVTVDAMDARARWDSMSAEDQSRLRKRFERLQQLDESEREELRRRAHDLKRQEREILKRLSPASQERLTQQPPSKRRELIAEMVQAERRDRGERIESKLPEKTREWLHNSPPKERRNRLEMFRQKTRERISTRAVEGLAQALGYGPDEIKRLERLPLEERMKTVMNLRRKLDEQQLVEGGLLKDFSSATWQRLEALPPQEYFAEILRLKHEEGIQHLSRLNREERLIRQEERAKEHDLSRELRSCLRVSPAELVELSTLSHEERKLEINRRRRASLVETMRKFEVLSDDQLADFAVLPDDDLFSRARALANGWSKAKRKSEPGEAPGEVQEFAEPGPRSGSSSDE